MNAWLVLLVLVGLVCVLGGLILIVWIGQPGRRRRPGGGQARLAGRVGCLVAVSGPLAGQTFALKPPPRGLVIGRSFDSDIVLDTLMVSRHHTQVMLEGEQVVLYDRDSTNGTWLIDGRRVSRHVLSIGDRFQIGDSAFVYAWPGQPVPPPLPAPLPLRPVLDVQPNTYFEGYLLLDLLGHGGMSVVYRAQAPDGAHVAIKIIDVTDEWVARKFVQEGNIGLALRGHPNIRVVYDLRYSQDNRPYLVMEYVEGISLRQLCKLGMPTAQVVSIVGQACEALAFAHQRRIVHRDIKPENILVQPDGLVKVTDFGIAKITSAVTVTSDRIVGTPEYISPEQARGEAVGPPSDIYSLGVVLYELLTGQVPFPLPPTSSDRDPRGAAYTVIRQHIYAAPTPPGCLNEAIASSPLELATLRALEKSPDKRYNQAMQLAESLGYQAGQAAPTPPLSAATARLLILDGPHQGQAIALSTGQLAIGRTLVDPTNTHISRQHAIVIQKGQEWWVQDVSMNGTWVNGQRVYGETPLGGERLIEIAGYKMQLQV